MAPLLGPVRRRAEAQHRGEVIVNLDAQVSAIEAAGWLSTAGVCRHRVYAWRSEGRITEVGKRGRSPLYRFGDVLQAEADTRMSGLSHRTAGCRSCERAAEHERDLVPA
jgi:hypothetical protein